MPPKGQKRTTVGGIFEREDDTLQERIAHIMDQRADQIMEVLTERMATMFDGFIQNMQTNQRGGVGEHRRRQPDWEVEDDGEDGEYYEEIPQIRRRQPRVPVEDDNRRWEMGMRTEIAEFHGGLTAEEYLDWVATVEEVFEFKRVPEDRKVTLIATRLRGRASAWWQQLKLSRVRSGKPKIVTWEKMKKQMSAEFLPYNYQRTLYQRLQNLRQGQKSVDQYTTEFYQLMARNEIHETSDQVVARYIGGLRVALQDTLNMCDIYTVSAAHQRALMAEKQQSRRFNSGAVSGGMTSNNTGGAASSPATTAAAAGPSATRVQPF